jgi:hypothetical protein
MDKSELTKMLSIREKCKEKSYDINFIFPKTIISSVQKAFQNYNAAKQNSLSRGGLVSPWYSLGAGTSPGFLQQKTSN